MPAAKAAVAEYYANRRGTWPTALVGNAADPLGFTGRPSGKKRQRDRAGHEQHDHRDVCRFAGERPPVCHATSMDIRPGLSANGDIVWI